MSLPPKIVLGTVNGITRPIPGATITVCAANVGGIPCAPALANALFKDSGLTIPLANPTVSDSNGNYPTIFMAGGLYTITESAPGFAGFSAQVTVTCAPGAPCTVSAFTASSATITGALTAGSVNQTQFVAAGGTSTQINAAITALPSTGGIVQLGCGDFTLSATITISTKPVILMGCGASNTGATLAAQTRLIWAGGATPAISISSSSAVGTILQGFNLCANDCPGGSATGTFGIDIDNGGAGDANSTARISLQDVTVRGQFTTAGIRIGNTTTGQIVINIQLNRVDIVDNPTNLQILQVAHFVAYHLRTYNQGTVDVQIGDSTHNVYSARFEDCDIEPGGSVNVDDIVINNVLSATFHGCFFENHGTGFTFNIPSTANSAQGIVFESSRFQAAGGSPAFVGTVAKSTATVTIKDSVGSGYPAAANWIKNVNNKRIILQNLDDSTGTLGNFDTLANGNVDFIDTTSGGVNVGTQLTTPLVNRALLTANNGFTVGNNAAITIQEGGAVSAAASNDVCYADSTAHAIKCAFNNGSFFNIAQVGTPGTVGNLTPGIVAKADLTAQAANNSGFGTFAIGASGAGTYRVSCYLVVTQQATTSSTVPSCAVNYTDADTSTVNPAGSVMCPGGAGGTNPPVGTTCFSATAGNGQGTTVIQAKASTNISFSTGSYASVGATPMQYAVHVKLEYLGN